MVGNPLRRLWNDRMTVTVREPFKRADKSTGFQENAIIEDEPCKLSYSDSVAANSVSSSDGVASALTKTVKLFCSPDLDIPPGSRIAITHKGATTDFTHSSKPSVFTNHQEIILEVFKRWA